MRNVYTIGDLDPTAQALRDAAGKTYAAAGDVVPRHPSADALPSWGIVALGVVFAGGVLYLAHQVTS